MHQKGGELCSLEFAIEISVWTGIMTHWSWFCDSVSRAFWAERMQFSLLTSTEFQCWLSDQKRDFPVNQSSLQWKRVSISNEPGLESKAPVVRDTLITIAASLPRTHRVPEITLTIEDPFLALEDPFLSSRRQRELVSRRVWAREREQLSWSILVRYS